MKPALTGLGLVSALESVVGLLCTKKFKGVTWVNHVRSLLAV